MRASSRCALSSWHRRACAARHGSPSSQLSDVGRNSLHALGHELDELEERVDPFLEEWGSEEQTRRRRRGRLIGSANSVPMIRETPAARERDGREEIAASISTVEGVPDVSPDHLNQLSCVQMSHGSHGESTAIEMDGPLARAVAERMQVLASPSRVWILSRLKDGPCSVGELAEAVSMESSAVSHQLRQLRHLGLVVGERRGKQVIYGLHDPHVAELLDQAVFHVEHVRMGDRQPLAQASLTA